MAVEIITREDLNEFRSLLLTDLKEIFNLDIDSKADQWQKQFVYRETLTGLLEKGAASFVLELDKRYHRKIKNSREQR